MSTKNKPGIHLFKSKTSIYDKPLGVKPGWYWHIVSKNGRIIARSSETYTTKRSAVKSISIVASHFESNQHYFDHSTQNKVPDLVVYSIK
jgi:uncharacterized protein YegP (UPF0339 family)